MTNSKGFTLIELVIVIVILGILAATAAPKFIDLTGDARESVIKGVEGSMNSAADIVHAKALIEGKLDATGTQAVSAGSSNITVKNGWPTADAAGIGAAIELSTDSDIISEATSATEFSYYHDGAPTPSAANCGVSYTEAVDTETRPAIISTTDAC